MIPLIYMKYSNGMHFMKTYSQREIFSAVTWKNHVYPAVIFHSIITSTQVAADRGALRIWRWVSLPEEGQKFLLLWQLADTAWLVCARVAVTRSAAERPSNAPTQPHSLQPSHLHLNSIFAIKLHAQDPLHWVICIRLICWHGAHLQAVVIVMEILLN